MYNTKTVLTDIDLVSCVLEKKSKTERDAVHVSLQLRDE